jgi:hypothetical protein
LIITRRFKFITIIPLVYQKIIVLLNLPIISQPLLLIMPPIKDSTTIIKIGMEFCSATQTPRNKVNNSFRVLHNKLASTLRKTLWRMTFYPRQGPRKPQNRVKIQLRLITNFIFIRTLIVENSGLLISSLGHQMMKSIKTSKLLQTFKDML